MVELNPRKLKTETLIEEEEVLNDFREHMGASQIGRSCPRQIWFDFRWFKDITFKPRVMRLFKRGHREEPIVLSDLKSIGIKVKATQEKANFAKGHGGGSHDGRLIGVPDAPKTEHLFECKTMNDRSFKSLKSGGVKQSFPVYYAQMQVYMHLFKLKRALFVSVNKNDDYRYYERIKYNKTEASFYINRAEDLVFTQKLPQQIKNDENYYQCRWCDYKSLCYTNEPARIGCRTCKFSIPLPDTPCEWQCLKSKKKLKRKKQLKGCKKWKSLI